MAVSVSKVVLEMTKIIQKIKPTALVVYGDRYETFAASVAGHENNLIVAHIEGGDITNGGTHDDNLRHAITKLSHLHFPTNKLSYKKILSLGEETWRVNMVGFSAFDLIKKLVSSPSSKLATMKSSSTILASLIFQNKLSRGNFDEETCPV